MRSTYVLVRHIFWNFCINTSLKLTFCIFQLLATCNSQEVAKCAFCEISTSHESRNNCTQSRKHIKSRGPLNCNCKLIIFVFRNKFIAWLHFNNRQNRASTTIRRQNQYSRMKSIDWTCFFQHLNLIDLITRYNNSKQMLVEQSQ